MLMEIILAISIARGSGGAERSFEELLRALLKDYCVKLLVENSEHADRCRKIFADFPQSSVNVLPKLPRPIQILLGALYALRFSRRYIPRLTIANSNKSGLVLAIASLASAYLKNSSVLYIRDFQWRWLKFILQQLDHASILVPSLALEEHIQSNISKGKRRIYAVPNIVEVPTMADRPASTDPRLGNFPYVLLLATVQRWKGQEYLVRALTQLPPSISAVICGNIREEAYLTYIHELAAKHGVSNRLIVLPYVDNPHTLIRNAACVVVTSVAAHGGPESFGRVIVEAWAHKVPVVAFSVGGPRYLITDGMNGYLVPETDWQSLAKRIITIVENPSISAAIGDAGYQEARKKYNSDAVYETFRKVLLETPR